MRMSENRLIWLFLVCCMQRKGAYLLLQVIFHRGEEQTAQADAEMYLGAYHALMSHESKSHYALSGLELLKQIISGSTQKLPASACQKGPTLCRLTLEHEKWHACHGCLRLGSSICLCPADTPQAGASCTRRPGRALKAQVWLTMYVAVHI